MNTRVENLMKALIYKENGEENFKVNLNSFSGNLVHTGEKSPYYFVATDFRKYDAEGLYHNTPFEELQMIFVKEKEQLSRYLPKEKFGNGIQEIKYQFFVPHFVLLNSPEFARQIFIDNFYYSFRDIELEEIKKEDRLPDISFGRGYFFQISWPKIRLVKHDVYKSEFEVLINLKYQK